MPVENPPDGMNRAAITVCVILATLKQALDTSIANVLALHAEECLVEP
jgi:MFS transporter, DHA2 family, multidrug resistance protein